MNLVSVDVSANPYQVKIAPGLLREIGKEAKALALRPRCVIVTDSNVGALYAEAAVRALKDEGFQPLVLNVPAGEASKSLTCAERLLSAMAEGGLDRRAWLLALGGGVVGDLAGMVASLFFRGIPYVQVPTTVVAQVDSSVGGKTGVNLPEGKNLVGAFYQPKRVLIDPEMLNTLPKREFNEGFAEIVKHAAIRDAEMFSLIERIVDHGWDAHLMTELIASNVQIKANIVSEDEYETKGTRALLNFGHTIGHAVESAAGYGELFHGEAVSIGLAAALWLSEHILGLPRESSERVIALLEKLNLPTHLPEDMTDALILEKMGRDKKFEEGKYRFVLLPALGEAIVSDQVTREMVLESLKRLRIS